MGDPPHSDGQRRAPTIYDVAHAAGVAASTVSRAFSRPGRVNAATAEHIRQVAAELGYRTNPLARALPTGCSSMIAFVISDITNPFYAPIIQGAQSAAGEAGYVLLLVDAQESDVREREALERALPTVEGVVLASSRMSDSAIRMNAKQRPTIVLNRAVSDVPSVVTDNSHGMQLAAGHLAGLGHRNITYLAGPEASWADGMRWRSLREAAAGAGLRVHRHGPCAPTIEGGTKAALELGHAPASAVIAYNDQLAIGLMRGLRAAGKQVPRDVSVVGFDNIHVAELVSPGLTTVAAPLRAQGHAAVRSLLSMLDGAQMRTGDPEVLPVRLMVRASTARRRHKRVSPGGSRPADDAGLRIADTP